MVGISLPGTDQLPPGPLRELVEALHQLYRGAGMPGLRRIARAVMDGDFRDTVSHEKVAAMLRGTGLGRWSKLEPVVRVLAGWNSPPLDPDEYAGRIQRLWYVAVSADQLTTDTPLGVAPPEDRRAEKAGTWAAAVSSDGTAPDDASILVAEVGAELRARAQAERRADEERGFRQGVKFARELPSPSSLEELTAVNFDVATWIAPKRQAWGYRAAGLDSTGTDLPEWTWAAARYLGSLADPIGSDEFSFTPSKAYLGGFGEGLRAVWTATFAHDSTAGAGAAPASTGAQGSVRIAEQLTQLLRGHGGLSLDEVEQAGQRLLQNLRERFDQAPVRELLPDGAGMTVEWFRASGPCDYGNRPYRLLNWHYHGLKIVVTMGKPEPLRVESTPVPGISRGRDAEHALIVIDANRPSAPPLQLCIGDVHPAVSAPGESTIDNYVEQVLTILLTEFGQTLTGALARQGYDS